MTGSDTVEWGLAALPFLGMSAIPVAVNLAVTGWDLARVSWVAWGLSAWLLVVSVMGIRAAIAEGDRPARGLGREDQTRI